MFKTFIKSKTEINIRLRKFTSLPFYLYGLYFKENNLEGSYMKKNAKNKTHKAKVHTPEEIIISEKVDMYLNSLPVGAGEPLGLMKDYYKLFK